MNPSRYLTVLEDMVQQLLDVMPVLRYGDVDSVPLLMKNLGILYQLLWNHDPNGESRLEEGVRMIQAFEWYVKMLPAQSDHDLPAMLRFLESTVRGSPSRRALDAGQWKTPFYEKYLGKDIEVRRLLSKNPQMVVPATPEGIRK